MKVGIYTIVVSSAIGNNGHRSALTAEPANAQLSLVSLISQRLESGEVELPVFDRIALRIHRETRENRLDANGICSILQEDPALVGGGSTSRTRASRPRRIGTACVLRPHAVPDLDFRQLASAAPTA